MGEAKRAKNQTVEWVELSLWQAANTGCKKRPKARLWTRQAAGFRCVEMATSARPRWGSLKTPDQAAEFDSFRAHFASHTFQ